MVIIFVLFLKFTYSEKATKSSPIIWLAIHRTNNWWRFRKNLQPSQNVWALQIGNQAAGQQIDKNYQELMVILILSFGLRFIWKSKTGYFPDEILKYRSLWHSNATMYQLKIWERSPRVIKIGIEPFSPFYCISCEVCLSLWVFDRDSLSHKKGTATPHFMASIWKSWKGVKSCNKHPTGLK